MKRRLFAHAIAPCSTALAAVALAGIASAAAAQRAPAPWQAEVGYGREALSRGLEDWTQLDAALRWRRARRESYELSLRRTERFGLQDRAWALAAELPLGPDWDFSLEVGASPSHRILARSTASVGVRRALGQGWNVSAGLRTTRYDIDRANTLSLGAERYCGSDSIGEWRVAGAVLASQLPGVGSTTAWRLQADRYFAERARLGLIVAAGREIDNLGQGNVVVSNVESVALVGRVALGDGWALVGDIGRTRLGSLYRRGGGRLGVQLDF